MALGGSWPMTTPRPPTPTSVVGSLDRHADQSGGSAPGGVGRFIPRFDDPVTLTREQVNGAEETIQHERIPVYDSNYMTSNHDTLVNWTDCGPIRPSLWMRNTTVNRQVGTSATRNFDPHPITTLGTQDQGHGMHTNPSQPKAAVNKNFRARQQQQPARVNRLSPSVRSGQSYSQTTTIQGGAR
jgi:hypothetical protein